MFAQIKAHAGANQTPNSMAPTAIQDTTLRVWLAGRVFI